MRIYQIILMCAVSQVVFAADSVDSLLSTPDHAAAQLTVSYLKLNNLSSGNQIDPISFQMGFEFMPEFLQFFGLFGVGPRFSLYRDLTNIVTSAGFGLGLSVTYQFRYTPNQSIVPIVSYQADYFVNFFGGGRSAGILLSPGAGFMIFLNRFENNTAHELFYNTGIKRTYLTLLARSVAFNQSDNNLVAIANPSIMPYLGLRFEF